MVNTDRGVEDIPTDRKPDIDDRGGWECPWCGERFVAAVM